MIVNFNAPWDQLTQCIVGRGYAPEFYQDIKDSKVRESLQKISIETEEDYSNIVKVLESLNVSVTRPCVNDQLNIMDFVNSDGRVGFNESKSFTLIPRPPMQPRDSFLVVGNKLIKTLDESNWYNLPGGITSDKAFDAPLVTVIGKHLIVDCREYPWLAEYMQSINPDRIIVPVHIGGHI